MKDNVEISIVIPVYNVEKYLGECMEYLLKTDIPASHEILMVNDGTKDNSRDVGIDIINKNPKRNIKMLDKENGGLSSARNYGFDAAKGKYIFFLDSDDFIDIQDIYKMYILAEETEADVVFGNGKFYYEDKKEDNKPFYAGKKLEEKFKDKKPVSGKEMFTYMIEENCYKMEVWDRLYRKEFLEKNNIRFYEGIFHEDELYTPCVLSKAEKAVYFGDIGYNYRQRSGSITKALGVKNCMDYMIVLENLKKIMEENKTDERYTLAMAERIVQVYFRIYQIAVMFENPEDRKKVKEKLDINEIDKYMNLIGFKAGYWMRKQLLVKNDRVYASLYKTYKKARQKLTGKI